MISVSEAEKIIYESLPYAQTCSIPISSLKSEILREDLFADRPLPPFDRVAMDGIALNFRAWKEGVKSFAIEGIQAAGDPLKTLKDPTNCLEAMTGAVLPEGCDCVVPVEQITIKNGMAILQENLELKQFQNIHQKGGDTSEGDLLLKEGSLMRGVHWAVAASIGQSEVLVSKRPSIAVISTGDELVDVSDQPLAHQIRRSNVYAIQSSLVNHGFTDIELFHLPDNKENMFETLKGIFNEKQVVLLSGGVSKGKFDFVPQILSDLGVQEKFHKITQKPGKPLWFGMGQKDQIVFGLPGNPVSALVCLHRYVLPGLWKHLTGFAPKLTTRASLQSDVSFKKDFTLFQPVSVSYGEKGQIIAEPIKGNGSGDFSSLARSDGFLELPADKKEYLKDEVYPLWLWRSEL